MLRTPCWREQGAPHYGTGETEARGRFSSHTANKGQGQESNIWPDTKFLAVNHTGAKTPGVTLLCSLSNYFLSVYCVTGSDLGAGDSAMHAQTASIVSTKRKRHRKADYAQFTDGGAEASTPCRLSPNPLLRVLSLDEYFLRTYGGSGAVPGAGTPGVTGPSTVPAFGSVTLLTSSSPAAAAPET